MESTRNTAKGIPHAVEAGQVVIEGAESWSLSSELSGRAYRIMIFRPVEPPPEAGYPIIYMLDANSSFATASETVRYQTKKPHGYDPAILVGIGYPQSLSANQERFLDYTTPAEPDKLPKRGDGSPWPAIGGAEAFLDFIEQELKPWVESRFPVDRTRQAFLGHSLGGFLVLHTLFTRRHSFQTYAAGSPSIWWNDCMLFEEEKVFLQQLEEEADRKTNEKDTVLFIAAGELEREHQSRMFENAEEMGRRLSCFEGKGLQTVTREFEDNGHVSVIPAFIVQGIRMALSKTKDERRQNL